MGRACGVGVIWEVGRVVDVLERRIVFALSSRKRCSPTASSSRCPSIDEGLAG